MKIAIIRYCIIINISLTAFLYPILSTAQTISSERIDIQDYIDRSLKGVATSLEQKSIAIEWASELESYQILAYKTVIKFSDHVDQELYVKCFFKRSKCFGKVIRILNYSLKDIERYKLLNSSQEIPLKLEIEESDNHVTIFITKGNITKLKKLNNTPAVIKPLKEIIEKSNKVQRYLWATLQVGFPYYESIFKNFGTSISYSSDKIDLIYILQYKATKYDDGLLINDIDEISYMSAYLLSKGKIRMTFCAGLSYLIWRESIIDNSGFESTRDENLLGVPVEAQYYVRISEKFGLGVSLRANLNGLRSFYQFSTYILFGKIR